MADLLHDDAAISPVSTVIWWSQLYYTIIKENKGYSPHATCMIYYAALYRGQH